MQAWCNLQVKLCDPCLSAFEALCVKMRYTNGRILCFKSQLIDSYFFYKNSTRWRKLRVKALPHWSSGAVVDWKVGSGRDASNSRLGHGRKSRGLGDKSPRIWSGDANANCLPQNLSCYKISSTSFLHCNAVKSLQTP